MSASLSIVSVCTVLPTLFFFFNDTATTEIYTLSLHDALPICQPAAHALDHAQGDGQAQARAFHRPARGPAHGRSEEHTSELQSHSDLVCRLLLEKKKKKTENKEWRKRYRYLSRL